VVRASGRPRSLAGSRPAPINLRGRTAASGCRDSRRESAKPRPIDYAGDRSIQTRAAGDSSRFAWHEWITASDRFPPSDCRPRPPGLEPAGWEFAPGAESSLEADTCVKQPFRTRAGRRPDGNNHLDRSLVQAPQSTPFGSRASRKGREMRPFLRGARNSMSELRRDQVGRDGSLELTISSATSRPLLTVSALHQLTRCRAVVWGRQVPRGGVVATAGVFTPHAVQLCGHFVCSSILFWRAS